MAGDGVGDKHLANLGTGLVGGVNKSCAHASQGIQNTYRIFHELIPIAVVACIPVNRYLSNNHGPHLQNVMASDDGAIPGESESTDGLIDQYRRYAIVKVPEPCPWCVSLSHHAHVVVQQQEIPAVLLCSRQISVVFAARGVSVFSAFSS